MYVSQKIISNFFWNLKKYTLSEGINMFGFPPNYSSQ